MEQQTTRQTRIGEAIGETHKDTGQPTGKNMGQLEGMPLNTCGKPPVNHTKTMRSTSENAGYQR